MIKINLCPIDELENPYWYIPDVAILVVVAILGYYGVSLYFGEIEDQIITTQEKISSLQASTSQLAPDLARFKTLDVDVNTLSGKLRSLQKITISKMEKYTPIIVLEHIQNLKPQGVWYTEFSLKNAQSTEFSLKGIAFDNMMTAELLTSMRATASSEVDPTDLRSQVFFDKLSLVETAIAPLTTTSSDSTAETTLFPPSNFDIKGIVLERATAVAPPQPKPQTPVANPSQPQTPPQPTASTKTHKETEGSASSMLQYARRGTTP